MEGACSGGLPDVHRRGCADVNTSGTVDRCCPYRLRYTLVAMQIPLKLSNTRAAPYCAPGGVGESAGDVQDRFRRLSSTR